MSRQLRSTLSSSRITSGSKLPAYICVDPFKNVALLLGHVVFLELGRKHPTKKTCMRVIWHAYRDRKDASELLQGVIAGRK